MIIVVTWRRAFVPEPPVGSDLSAESIVMAWSETEAIAVPFEIS